MATLTYTEHLSFSVCFRDIFSYHPHVESLSHFYTWGNLVSKKFIDFLKGTQKIEIKAEAETQVYLTSKSIVCLLRYNLWCFSPKYPKWQNRMNMFPWRRLGSLKRSCPKCKLLLSLTRDCKNAYKMCIFFYNVFIIIETVSKMIAQIT